MRHSYFYKNVINSHSNAKKWEYTCFAIRMVIIFNQLCVFYTGSALKDEDHSFSIIFWASWFVLVTLLSSYCQWQLYYLLENTLFVQYQFYFQMNSGVITSVLIIAFLLLNFYSNSNCFYFSGHFLFNKDFLSPGFLKFCIHVIF